MGSTTREAVQRYIDEGFGRPHPIPRGKKGPLVKWNDPTRRFVLDAFDVDGNVGTLLGDDVGGLVDIDLDCPQAVQAAARLLPPTPRVHGRPSVGASHCWYLSPGTTSEQFKGPDGAMLVEIRASAHQTVLPPSTHPGGERLTWFQNGSPAVVAADTLRAAVRNVAVAALLAQHWPARGRHEVRLALGGLLHGAGVGEAEAIKLIETAATLGGSDATGVRDVERAVRDSYAKLERGERVTGAPKLAEMLGPAIVTCLRTFLHIDANREINAGVRDLKTITPDAWEAIAQANDPPRLFIHGGAPTRIEHAARKGDARRVCSFVPLNADRLRHEAARATDWFKVTKGVTRLVEPPMSVIKDMLATPAEGIPLPLVTRITHAPVVASGGTVQTTPGYQPATGTYYVADGLEVHTVADAPTQQAVRQAVEWIERMIVDFPFVGETDRAHAIAFLLLPFVRDVIDGLTPLHLFEKPTAGTGATLLTDVLLYPSVGTDVAKISTVTDDDEWRKQITSTLMEGPTVVLIDNARELTSPQLAKALTDRIWKSRVLGVSRDVNLQVECVWGATGNNPVLHQEIARRVVPIRLDSGTERPFQGRTFTISNLRVWVAARRGDLVWAALTIARAWFAAGCPDGARSLGMYERWAEVIGGMLDVAGVGGFLTNLDAFYDQDDLEGDAIHWFIERWSREHGTTPVRVGQVASWALASDSEILPLLGERLSDRGLQTRFSLFVRRLKGRVATVDGVRMRVEGVRQAGRPSRTTWRVASVPEQMPLAAAS